MFKYIAYLNQIAIFEKAETLFFSYQIPTKLIVLVKIIVEYFKYEVTGFDRSILIIIQDFTILKNLSTKEPIDCPNCFFKRHL